MGVTYTQYFLDVIKSILNKTPFETSAEGVDFARLYALASAHGMSGMLGWCDAAMAAVPKEIGDKIISDKNQNIAREATQEIVISAFLEEMEKTGMRAMPLKGFYIKNLYPHPAMRTMSDTDILIEESDMNRIVPIMASLGFRHSRDTDNESVFETAQLSVELHRKLIDDTKGRLREYYKDGWVFAKPALGKKHIYCMSDEDFYIFAVNHIAKHYTGGGIGIRHMMDIYVLLQNGYNWEYINKEFRTLGISKFAERVKQLSLVWFSSRPSIGFDVEIWEFGKAILSSGSFGETNQRMIAAMHTAKQTKEKSVSGTTMLIRRIIPTMEHMKILYPAVRKHGWLYPVFWIRRAWDICFNRRSEIKYWTTAVNVKPSDVEQFEEKLKKAGIPEDF